MNQGINTQHPEGPPETLEPTAQQGGDKDWALDFGLSPLRLGRPGALVEAQRRGRSGWEDEEVEE